jgi:hypothetical protein
MPVVNEYVDKQYFKKAEWIKAACSTTNFNITGDIEFTLTPVNI